MAAARPAGRLLASPPPFPAGGGLAERPGLVLAAMSRAAFVAAFVARLIATDASCAFARLRPSPAHGSGEITARKLDDARAELSAQRLGLHLLDRAFGKITEIERAKRHPDQAVHLKPEMGEHVPHLAVLALADRKAEPDIGALLAIERRLDRPIMDSVNGDAAPQLVEIGLPDAAMSADAVAPQPSRLGQFQHAGERAIIGEQQQPLAADIEAPDTDKPGQIVRKSVEQSRAALRVGVGADETDRLVIAEQSRALAPRQRLAVDGDGAL
jgi:hypothetical protein